MSLSRLIYFSTNALVGGAAVAEDLKRILHSSIRNNTATGLTGGLLFNRDYFVQVLEGDDTELSRTLARIRLDAAHRDIVLVEDPKPAKVRLFGTWSMGFAGKTQLFNQLSKSVCPGGVFDPRNMTADELTSFVLQLVTKESSFVSSPRYEAFEI